MTAAAPRLRPECQMQEHELCHGPDEVRIPGCSVPVLTYRCDCPCHRKDDR